MAATSYEQDSFVLFVSAKIKNFEIPDKIDKRRG